MLTRTVQNATKYLTAATTLAVILLFSACHALPRAPISVAVTPTPMRAETARSHSPASSERAQPTQTQLAKDSVARESFEDLRTAAAQCAPENDELSDALVQYLIKINQDSIMLAVPIVFSSDTQETAEKRYHVALTMISEYKLSDSKICESECKTVPVLIKARKGTSEIEQVWVPDLYDDEKYLSDIKDIFGVMDEDDLGLWNHDDPVSDIVLWRYISQMSLFKCDIALAGGFEGFQNEVIRIVSEMDKHGYLDISDINGALRSYYINNTFRYDTLAVPFCYELARESEDSDTTLYGALYIGYIYAMDDGTLMTGAEERPCRLDILQTDAGYNTYDVLSQHEGAKDYETMISGMGKYRDEYLKFHDSADYDDYIMTCDRAIDTLLGGTFDFSSDTLDYGN